MKVPPAYIIEDSISLRHQPSDRRSVHNFSIVPTQRAPELPEVHLELVAPPIPNRVQQRVEMFDKPSPNFSGSHSFR